MPEGFHPNPNAPQRYEISLEGAQSIKIENPKQKFKDLPLVVPFQTIKTGTENIKASLTIYYCREDNTGVCLIKTLAWNVPVKIVSGKSSANKIELSAKVE